MPSYSLLADYDEEDEWQDVKGRAKEKKKPAAAEVKPAPAATAAASSGAAATATKPAASQSAPSAQTARPKGVKLELDARDYTRYSPRVNTHDHSTGRPVAEDYYRAFMRCYKDASTGNVILRFHKTNVVTIMPNGDIQLYCNGYFTYTTLCSMNDALQFIDIKLTVRGEVKDPNNWQVQVSRNPPQDFYDNMIVKARNQDDRSRGQEVLEAMKGLLEQPQDHHRGGADRGHAGGGGAAASSAAQRPALPPAPPQPAHNAAAEAHPPPLPKAPAAAAPAPMAKGSAWGAAPGRLATKLAAEAQKPTTPPGPGDFPPLGGAAGKPGTAAGTGAAAAAPAPAANGSAAAAAASRARPGPAASSGAAPPVVSRAPPPAPSARTLEPVAAPVHGNGVSRQQHQQQQRAMAPPAPAPAPAKTGVLPDSLDELYGGHTALGNGLFAPSNLAAIHEVYAAQSAAWDAQDGTVAGADDERMCIVCMHNVSDTILIPCSHTILCRACADTVVNQLTPGSTAECPLCRAEVDLVLDVQ